MVSDTIYYCTMHGVLLFKVWMWALRQTKKTPNKSKYSPPRTPNLSWPWAFPGLFFFWYMLYETWECVQICHSIQDQLWKLEVRRLLQWASNGRIMQLRSSGCPHYIAVVVINGLKCTLSKSQEKCDPSAKIQMVPLQRHSKRSLYILFIMLKLRSI